MVVTRYTYKDSSVRVTASLSFTDDPAVVVNPADLASIAGIYVSKGSLTLQNGTVIPTESYTRIHPDGSGLNEFNQYDPVTGDLTSVTASELGFCASVNGKKMASISYIFAPSELYSGSIIPSASHCATLTNSEVSLQFDYRLYDLGPQGASRNVTRESVNDCGSLPSINPQPPGCVPTLSTTAYFETK